MEDHGTSSSQQQQEQQQQQQQQEQQQQQQQPVHQSPVQQLSVQALENTCNSILENNFDVDTKVCFITMMKVLDNIIQKQPRTNSNNAKVRSIPLSNPNFQTKVGSCTGSIDFLIACGFTLMDNNNNNNSIGISSISNNNNNNQCLLVLTETMEDIRHLITARRLLTTRCLQELKCTNDELPKYQPPPPAIRLVVPNNDNAPTTTTSNTANNAAFVFNPYVRHRFDVQNAVGGTNESTYVSKTELEIQKLLEKQKSLEQQHQQASSSDRNNADHHHASSNNTWIAYQPDEPIVTTTANTASHTAGLLGGGGGGGGGGGDSSLLMQHLKKQQDLVKQREAGFTTKAMRDLQSLKKQKVYGTVSLSIQFPDGYKLVSTNSFVPKDTINTIIQSIQQQCFLPTKQQHQPYVFDLYVAPPRRLLQIHKTLQEEDLVPAAKVFVSWKRSSSTAAKQSPLPPVPTPPYLKVELFDAKRKQQQQQYNNTATGLFPTGQALVDDDITKDGNINNSGGENEGKKEKKPAQPLSREEALLQRMMGGGGGGGRGGNSSSDTTIAKKPSGTGNNNKPKWFK